MVKRRWVVLRSKVCAVLPGADHYAADHVPEQVKTFVDVETGRKLQYRSNLLRPQVKAERPLGQARKSPPAEYSKVRE